MIARIARNTFWLALAGVITIGTLANADADEKKKDEKKKKPAIEIAAANLGRKVDFEKDVLPILRKNCLACHNSTEAESDLVLESPAAILKGGSEGPSAIAKQPDKSLMLRMSAHQMEPFMPPLDNEVGAETLTPQQLGIIKQWIDEGATGTVTSSQGPVTWQPLPDGLNPIYAVAVSPDGALAVCGRANQVFIYDVASGKEVARLTDPAMMKGGIYKKPGVAHLDFVQSIAFSPDGDLLATGGFRTVKLWRRPSNVQKLKFAAGEVTAVAVSTDGKWAATGEPNGAIKVWELASGKATKTLSGHAGAIGGLTFSADAKQLFSGSADKSIRAWDMAAGKEIAKLTTPAEITSLALVDSGKSIAGGQSDNMIRIWATPAAGASDPKGDDKKKDAPQDPKKDAKKEPAKVEGPKPIREIKGHTGPVVSLAAIGATAAQLLSGSSDGTARTWNVANGAQVRQFALGGPVASAAVSPDGKRVVAVGPNKVAKLFNAADGKQIAELKGDFRAAVKVARIGRRITLAKAKLKDRQDELKNSQNRKKTEDGNLKKTQDALAAADKAMQAKAEAAKKPTADKEAADKELEAATAEVKTTGEAKAQAEVVSKQAQEDVKKAQKSKDKKAIDEANKKVADAKKKSAEASKKAQQAAQRRKNAENNVKKVKAPFDKAVAEATSAKNAYQAAMRSVTAAKTSVDKAAAAIPVAEKAVATADQGVKTVEGEQKAASKVATDSQVPLTSVAFSGDGNQVAIGTNNGRVFVYSGVSGKPVEALEGHQGNVAAMAYAGPSLLTISAGKNAIIWDMAAAWKLERTIGNVDNGSDLVDRVIALDFSSDGKWLATGSGEPSRSGQLKIWNVADGALVRDFKDAHSDSIFSLEFSPDNAVLATAAADRFVKTFDTATGKIIKAFEGHTHHVLGVSWQRNGKTLVSGSADKQVKVWDFKTGDQKRTIKGLGKEVTSVNFVGDGEEFAISAGDKTVRTYKVSNGSQVRAFAGAADFVYSTALTEDGKMLVAGGADSVLRVWTTADGKAIQSFEPPKPPGADKSKGKTAAK